MAKGPNCHQLAVPDNLVPPVFVRGVIYLPIKPSVTPDEVYNTIRQGLIKTMHQIPVLSWKVFLRPPTRPDWIPGQLELRHDTSWDPPTDPRVDPRQLHRKDLSKEIDYTYRDLKDLGFPCDLFEDDVLVATPFFPNIAAGTDVFKAQINFVEGGCLLAAAFYHPVADAFGITLIIQAWAAHCNIASSHEVSWQTEEVAKRLQSNSWDRRILDKVFGEHDDGTFSLENVNDVAWAMIGLERDLQHSCLNIQPMDLFRKRLRFLALSIMPVLFNLIFIPEPSELWRFLKTAVYSAVVSTLSPPKAGPGKADRDSLVTHDLLSSNKDGDLDQQLENTERPKVQASCFFYISTTQFTQLKKDVNTKNPPGAMMTSGNDAIQALFWRCCLRARVNAKHAKTYPQDQISLLQCPTDTRGVYSSNLTTNYTGNLLVFKTASYPLYKLISEETSLQEIALAVRQTSSTITQENIHQSFILARGMKDYSAFNFPYSRVDGTAMLCTSLAAFPQEQFNLGDRVFGNGGSIDRLRPLMSGSNAVHRLCIILPRLQQGGLEVFVSLFPDELEELQNDEEFGRYATFVCN